MVFSAIQASKRKIKLLESSLMGNLMDFFSCWQKFSLRIQSVLNLFFFWVDLPCILPKLTVKLQWLNFTSLEKFVSCQCCQASVPVQSLCRSAGITNWPEEMEGTVCLRILLFLFYSNRNFGSSLIFSSIFVWKQESEMKKINKAATW